MAGLLLQIKRERGGEVHGQGRGPCLHNGRPTSLPSWVFTQPWSCVEAKVLERNCRCDQHARAPSKLHALTAVGDGAHPSWSPQDQVMEKQRSWGFHLQGTLQHGAQGQMLEGCGKMPPAGVRQEIWSGPPPAPTQKTEGDEPQNSIPPTLQPRWEEGWEWNICSFIPQIIECWALFK